MRAVFRTYSPAGGGEGEDYFDAVLVSGTASSAMWELAGLEHHFSHSVSTAARLFTENQSRGKRKRAEEGGSGSGLRDVGEISYASLIDQELRSGQGSRYVPMALPMAHSGP